ncbi:CDP-glycerol--glycerophosphate glycerophosphotransferase [Hahella sp. KA22]|uniref:CDP-glycerol glycerophosphotransferase family protein n=1 Tax=Hahella sp. KA22 TaxID=1628392 RepID=UPI000FDD07B4|nr:CDP-glycerol glycerophosphotransferase family protein [Hahella sp. KA22]AZZ90897.1 CDP-glycerol--glycerophosphate glycerophosphotransferase [Hahella sp. KA22]QAY54267.1 CDP-glycerol--glycerophosphate glycerophosphotransferase [Hahella sp. KA22]
MKIDKSNPSHWKALILSAIVVVASLLIRWINVGKRNKYVALYGHKLNGNLGALYWANEANKLNGAELIFLTMDEKYHEGLIENGVRSILLTKLSSASILASTVCVVSDHGLHAMSLLLKLTSIKFVDVWHGIPFKGFIPDDFSVQREYDEVWVTSEKVKEMYTSRFGFEEEHVKVTGYARTDILIKKSLDINKLKVRLRLPDHKKVILFAPTWRQDHEGRSVIPFGESSESYFKKLEDLCASQGCIVAFRTHLNSGEILTSSNYRNIYFLPHADFPNTEEILLVSDIMVCDWSSIAFDFLLLDRPTIFLDVPPPFKNGFSFGPEYRFGEIVGDQGEMLHALDMYIDNPGSYWDLYGVGCENVKADLYADLADGEASVRGLRRIEAIINGFSL